MAQYWWDPSMGDPLIEPPTGATIVLENDNLGEPCLSFSTTINGSHLSPIWPGSGAHPSAAMEVYYEGRLSSSASFRWHGMMIKVIPDTQTFFYTLRKNGTTLYLSKNTAIATNTETYLDQLVGISFTARAKFRGRFNAAETPTVMGKEWLSGDPEPEGWALTATDTTYPEAGVPGFWLRLTNGTFRFYLYAYGYGTNGDPAPTGPVGGARRRSPLLLTPW